jgi:hypothetical protein
MTLEYSDMKALREDVDSFADEHAEPGTDRAIRALCARFDVDPDCFEIIAGETAIAFVRAVPAAEAAQVTFGQAFFMGALYGEGRAKK